MHDVCADIREQTKKQEADQIAAAEKAGIKFFKLSDADMATLKKAGDVVQKKYAPEVNKLNAGDKYRPKDFLKEVQEYIGYKP